MNNKVTVLASANETLVTVNPNNPEYGYIRVGQTLSKFSPEGWIKNENRSFLLKGRVAELQNCGLSVGQGMPGRLVRQEALEPFDDYSQPKVAGDSGVICKVNGQPIYSRVVYDATGTMEDTLIAHDNKEEIVAALYGASNNLPVEGVTATEAFEDNTTDTNDVAETTVNESLNEEVEIEETINEVEEEVVAELDLETDFEL